MSIWDDYKTSVRTRINVKQDRLLLTERQWKLKHYVKLNDKCGKYLWVNAYCPNQELYLWDEEVRKMTDEELATYRAEEKEKRVARQKAFLQQQKVKKEEELLQLRREITQDIVKSIIKNTFTAQSKVQVMINGGTDMVENMIGKKVFLIDDLGDGEMLMCSDTVTAILIEENSMSVRCKTSGDEFWTVGKNAFFSESEAKQAFKVRCA